MNTTLASAGIPPDVLADGNLIVEHITAGKPVPQDVLRRVKQRAEAITSRLRKEFGIVDIGGPVIRELRGELPNS